MVLAADRPTASHGASSRCARLLLHEDAVVDAHAQQQHQRQHVEQLQALAGEAEQRQRRPGWPARSAPARARCGRGSAAAATGTPRHTRPAPPSPCRRGSGPAPRKSRPPCRPTARRRMPSPARAQQRHGRHSACRAGRRCWRSRPSTWPSHRWRHGSLAGVFRKSSTRQRHGLRAQVRAGGGGPFRVFADRLRQLRQRAAVGQQLLLDQRARAGLRAQRRHPVRQRLVAGDVAAARSADRGAA